MHIQVHTDKHIEGGERLNIYISEEIAGSLNRFSEKITRADVYLTDENAGKSANNDKRCMIEVKVEGGNPVAVTTYEATVEKALSVAIDKIVASLDTVFDKMKYG
jgi:ribosome-associated translation inhibitor RaiA